MDWAFMVRFLPLYQKAAVLTVSLGAAGIAAALLVGLTCVLIQYYRPPVLRSIVGAYIEVSRNTPLPIQLFFKACIIQSAHCFHLLIDTGGIPAWCGRCSPAGSTSA